MCAPNTVTKYFPKERRLYIPPGRFEAHLYPYVCIKQSTAFQYPFFFSRIYDETFFDHTQKSNPPKRGAEREKKELDISKTAYATPKSKFNLGSRANSN